MKVYAGVNERYVKKHDNQNNYTDCKMCKTEQ